jgi:ferritin-like metal-binding protein YciE
MRVMIADRGTGEPISLGAALLAGKKVAPDVINLLMEDHRVVLGWFNWYESASDPVTKRTIAAAICAALEAHMAGEEELFYPRAQQATGNVELLQRAYREHEGAKGLIASIKAGSADGEVALISQLRAGIEQHVIEEESELFPAVRATDLDLYAVGRFLAARRVERLFVLTGRDTKAGHELKEIPDMTISPNEASELFITGLKNAHGAASQCRTMVEAQLGRLENYPVLEAKLQSHLAEKDQQLARLEQILASVGESHSTAKDTAMSAMGALGTMAHSMAGDEIIKNSFASYALANFEAAAYETLLLFGEAAGQFDALPLLQQSLSEERAMAAFIAENLRPTGMRFLQLRSEGRQASH